MQKVTCASMFDETNRKKLTDSFPDVDFQFYATPQQAFSEGRDADIVVAFANELTKERVQQLPTVKWIHTLSSGVDALPFEELRARGIWVTNSRGVHATPMAEYTIGVLLELTKRFSYYEQLKKQKRWDDTRVSAELTGKSVGIIGTGSIGSAIAKRLRAFDTIVNGLNTGGREVPGFDWIGTLDDLSHLLETSDYVIITVPLTTQTRNLLSKEQLAQMKPTSYLINLSRGEVIEEAALIEALTKQTIAGAVLDVFHTEPLPTDHPLWELENVILTPHISDSSPHFFDRVTQVFIHNVQAYLSNDPSQLMNAVDLQKGY